MTLVRSMTLMKWNKRNKIFKCHVIVVILIMCSVRLCQHAELFSRDIPRELRSPKPKQRVLKLTVVCLQGVFLQKLVFFCLSNLRLKVQRAV